jgi:hypothetical protein
MSGGGCWFLVATWTQVPPFAYILAMHVSRNSENSCWYAHCVINSFLSSSPVLDFGSDETTTRKVDDVQNMAKC